MSDILDWVHLLRAQGSFSLADRVLREIVAKTDEEMGAEARQLLDARGSKVVTQRLLVTAGQSARR